MSYDGDAIEQVRVYEDEEGELIDQDTKSRTEVILSLLVDRDYCTAYKNDNGEWTRRDDVETVDVDRTTYIRTDGNSIAGDDLDELPEL